MNARAQLERLFHGGPAPAPAPPPVKAPPKPEKPGTRPAERPGQPDFPDPWRRKDIKPGYEPRPKSQYHRHVQRHLHRHLRAEALKLLQFNDLEEFTK